MAVVGSDFEFEMMWKMAMAANSLVPTALLVMDRHTAGFRNKTKKFDPL
jgi:hypothetical protein